MTTFLIVSFGALALIVTGLLYWGRRRHGPARDNEKAAADDALRKLYGQYWAEVRAATQTHLLGAPADEEWLARIQERAVYASVAEETTGKSARKSPQRAALLLGWLLAAPRIPARRGSCLLPCSPDCRGDLPGSGDLPRRGHAGGGHDGGDGGTAGGPAVLPARPAARLVGAGGQTAHRHRLAGH